MEEGWCGTVESESSMLSGALKWEREFGGGKADENAESRLRPDVIEAPMVVEAGRIGGRNSRSDTMPLVTPGAFGLLNGFEVAGRDCAG